MYKEAQKNKYDGFVAIIYSKKYESNFWFEKKLIFKNEQLTDYNYSRIAMCAYNNCIKDSLFSCAKFKICIYTADESHLLDVFFIKNGEIVGRAIPKGMYSFLPEILAVLCISLCAFLIWR